MECLFSVCPTQTAKRDTSGIESTSPSLYLKDHVNTISNKPTQIAAQNAIMGMVTKTAGSTKHAGNVPVKPEPIPAALKPWLKDHLNTVLLNPKPVQQRSELEPEQRQVHFLEASLGSPST